ncbi:MAG TPA: sigma-70 family RNA polymerase sigma factor [Actinomycetes bacterium]|jgi:RNA polymerase sigma-70 factor (ECF subfamily)|nr:sigma-70 family RNA polymerase sigma factor [Actinomycetes bacterium]
MPRWKGLERVRGAKAYRGLQDGELVALVAERDPGALEALYDRYGAVAYSLARQVLNDGPLAESVVQGVFLSLWRDAGRFDPERGTVDTFVLATTHHRAVEVVRREENLRRRPGPGQALGTVGGTLERAHAGAEPAERRVQVHAALDELPEAQRNALLLALFGGYTQREVASLVGAPLATVRTAMAGGMRRLREILREVGHRERHPWSRR